MVGVPVIINHKDLNDKNVDDERVGVVNSVWYDHKDGWYWCDGIIRNETAQNLITEKNWSVSCSYDVKTANDEGGSENNIKYDMEFLDGVFTHLALVNNPRYERANIVFNSKTVIQNADKEFVTVGEGDSAHAIPVDYLKKGNQPKQYGGLSEEQWIEDSAKYRELTKSNTLLTPDEVKFIGKYLGNALEDSEFSSTNKDFNEPTREHYKKLAEKIKRDIEQLKDWFDLSKHQEKHFNVVWKKYLKEHPEEFTNIKNNKISDEQFTDIYFEALAEVIVENSLNSVDNDKWITIKGNHILLKDGESISDAFRRHTGASFGKENKYTQKDSHKSSQSYDNILAQVKEDNKKNITPEDIVNNAVKNLGLDAKKVQDQIKFADEYNEGIKDKGLETYLKYSDGNGVYNRERAEYHKEIIKDLFKNSKNARPKDGEKPKFMVLGGRGGSGKSKFNGLVYNKDNYIVLDADAIKEMIPEYHGYNAFEVHEESSDILKQALKKARKAGLNVVLDGTMKSLGSTEKKIKDFSESGYDIEMYYMHLPREKAAERAVGRFMGDNGRYVPLDVLLDMKHNEENFDKLKKYASKWAFYNNDVPTKDDDPILVDKNY